jgi:hypothetical protein
VQIRCQSRVTKIFQGEKSPLQVVVESEGREPKLFKCRYVFNCSYSGLNQLGGDFTGVSVGLKQEVTEMALMRMPESLEGLGITVMDGPFFSIMPFPARGLHTLSHVRYTPHLHWSDASGMDPYARLQDYPCESRVDRMVRDVGRYIPDVLKTKHIDSLFEIKTVLVKNEGDDGRPILFERHSNLPGCYSILGGKIDNIYDVIETLEKENISSSDHGENSMVRW